MIGQCRVVREQFGAWHLSGKAGARPLLNIYPGELVVVFDIGKTNSARVAFTTKDGIFLETTYYRISVLTDEI